MRRESGWLQIGHKSEKWRWRHNLSTWRHRHILLTVFCFSCQVLLLLRVSCQYHHRSRVMTIFFYKGLIRNPEIRNTPVQGLTNIWGLEQVRVTKFCTDVSNEMLLKAAKCEEYILYRFWENKQGVLNYPQRSGLTY